MRTKQFKSALIQSALAVSFLLLASSPTRAQQVINLTAGPATATLPDGSTVPMWGYSCGVVATTNAAPAATCAALDSPAAAVSGAWSPVVITVTTGQTLQINLTNNLVFGTNTVPTSRREKPTTRSVANSRARSASEMRALLYTTPKATTIAKPR